MTGVHVLLSYHHQHIHGLVGHQLLHLLPSELLERRPSNGRILGLEGKRVSSGNISPMDSHRYYKSNCSVSPSLIVVPLASFDAFSICSRAALTLSTAEVLNAGPWDKDSRSPWLKQPSSGRSRFPRCVNRAEDRGNGAGAGTVTPP